MTIDNVFEMGIIYTEKSRALKVDFLIALLYVPNFRLHVAKWGLVRYNTLCNIESGCDL